MIYESKNRGSWLKRRFLSLHTSGSGNVTAIVEENLTKYHKSLVVQLVNTIANGDIKTLTNMQFMLGFADHQISSCGKLWNAFNTIRHLQVC